jgi:hypothetical protein
MNKEKFISEYLDYVNNYLTVAKFAEHRQITEEEAQTIITTGRMFYLRSQTRLICAICSSTMFIVKEREDGFTSVEHHCI